MGHCAWAVGASQPDPFPFVPGRPFPSIPFLLDPSSISIPTQAVVLFVHSIVESICPSILLLPSFFHSIPFVQSIPFLHSIPFHSMFRPSDRPAACICSPTRICFCAAFSSGRSAGSGRGRPRPVRAHPSVATARKLGTTTNPPPRVSVQQLITGALDASGWNSPASCGATCHPNPVIGASCFPGRRRGPLRGSPPRNGHLKDSGARANHLPVSVQPKRRC